MIISQNVDSLLCGGAHIALDATGTIYVAYIVWDQDNWNRDVYFTKSTDSGNSFSIPIIVNDSMIVKHQAYPSVAVDSSGQYVYVVWEDWRNLQYEPDIYFSRSTDGGSTFLPSVRVNDDLDTANQWYPVIACDNSGQNVYVAWMDERDTLHGWDVYFSRSTDYGQTFALNYPVNDTMTTGGTAQWAPSICWKNGVIYLVWRDGRDAYTIYFAKSIDDGVSFGPNIPVRDVAVIGGAYPSIAVDATGYIYITWQDTRSYSTYGDEIYFAFSSDSGQTFKENVLVNDHQGIRNAWDWRPSICVNDSGKVFVAWSSSRNDPAISYFDIYCAAGMYVGIEEDRRSQVVTSLQYYPNPFHQKLTISFRASVTDNPVELKIYDVAGRLIKEYSFIPIGLHVPISVTWDGVDEQGITVPAGVYIIYLLDNGTGCAKKVVKIN